MATANELVASTVMDNAAGLMNDSAKTTYTYAAQLPYLQMALLELREKYELNNIPVTETSSEEIDVPAGETEITFGNLVGPALPDDLVEPQQLWEKNTGIDPYIPMTRVDFLPHYLAGTPTNQFIYYVWQDQKIKFLESTADNTIKIDYIKQLFMELVDENTAINVINAQSFLQYRTAGLMAEFIERNLPSANSMNAYASLAMDRALGIGVKGKQAIQTRRRPFRQAWKRRVGGWSR
jgi:hypothetical protein